MRVEITLEWWCPYGGTVCAVCWFVLVEKMLVPMFALPFPSEPGTVVAAVDSVEILGRYGA
jgi:hypothetical protein